MDPVFMEEVEKLREALGYPIRVSSVYRCPDYNSQFSSTGSMGPHTTGKALDILVSGRNAHELIKSALKHGFTGIGISQNGPHSKRFSHLDKMDDLSKRPWIWSH